MKSLDEIVASNAGPPLVMGADEPAPAPKKKRKASTSPTSRTLAECKKLGYSAQVVERRLPRTFTTVDLFGVIDVVAIATSYGGESRILGIQATTGAHHADRRAKILAEHRAKLWVAAGGRLELWTWSQRVAHNQDGSKAKRPRWTLRVEAFSAADWGAVVERFDAARRKR